MEKYSYEIGGKRFAQKPLVLGQITQLLGVLRGVILTGALTPLGIAAALGDKLPKALASVLNPEGVAIKDKDLAAIEGDVFNMDPDMAIEVIGDFFECNPLSSLFDRLTALGRQLTEKKRATGSGSLSTRAQGHEEKSSGSASSSPEGTSPKETLSSGATH